MDQFVPSEQPVGEVRMRDLLRFAVPPSGVSSRDRAAYASAVETMGGHLGLTQADHKTLKQAYGGDLQLQAFLAQDKPKAGKAGPTQPAGDIKQGLIQRVGDALRSQCQQVGEKCLKQAAGMADAAEAMRSHPKLAKLCPVLGALAKGISALGNAIRGITGQGDPKQMAADLANAVKDLLELMKGTRLDKLAKIGSKLLPGLGELTTGWDFYSAVRSARENNQKGNKAAAMAWSVVAGLNSLAFSLRATCDLAAVLTALTVGGASPGTAPVMATCETVVGVMAGASELVAIALE
ncbi:MAG: hypothetical protein J0I12_08690 [Candidatus Eremiobacteraeota bacterium]|nr:hypothetical protein [Candidatus Eremiobacteraeota bacterium]